MTDLNSIVSKLGQSGLLSGLTGGLAAGTLVSALGTKTGRKMGKTALKAGAFAAVGGIAWKAYDTYSKRNQTGNTRDFSNVANYTDSRHQHTYQDIPQQRFDAVANDHQGDTGQLLLLRAMISAAHADGHIDQAESQRIFSKVDELNFSPSEKGLIFDELRAPLSLNEITSMVSDAETAIEVYTASALVVDEHTPSSMNYLNQLRMNLAIPSELVARVHSEISHTKQLKHSSVA